jgi:RNA polymerase sigma-70 factor (ECF subfamily)
MPDEVHNPLGDASRLATVTSTSLLEGLRGSGNDEAWVPFVERYRPLIVRYARRLGLGEVDAEDVAQSSLLGFAKSYADGRYEREQGRLRAWLFGIVRKQVLHWQRGAGELARRGMAAEGGSGELDLSAPPGELERCWEDEWRNGVLAACLDLVRNEVESETLLAFERFAIEGQPVDEVAVALNLTPNAVYGAKRRVLRRLHELQPLMEDIW